MPAFTENPCLAEAKESEMTLYPPSNTDFPFKSSCTARAVAGGAGRCARSRRAAGGTGVARGAGDARDRGGARCAGAAAAGGTGGGRAGPARVLHDGYGEAGGADAGGRQGAWQPAGTAVTGGVGRRIRGDGAFSGRGRAVLVVDRVGAVRRRQVEPHGGACWIPEISPLGSELLHQEQAVSLGCVEVALHYGYARGAVVDDLHEDAVRDADDDNGDGTAVHAGLGVQDRVGDDLGRK